MKVIVDASMDEFTQNPTLLSVYTPRYLEAIYELLNDNKFGPKIMKLLMQQHLITVHVYQEPIKEKGKKGEFWERYTRTIAVVTLKDEQ